MEIGIGWIVIVGCFLALHIIGSSERDRKIRELQSQLNSMKWQVTKLEEELLR